MRLRLVRGDRIAAVTGRARQTQSVFAISEFVERLRGTKLVHRFNLRVTFQTAFEGGSDWRLICVRPRKNDCQTDADAEKKNEN